MHEYSIAQALLERVDVEARTREASAVHRIRVRIGEMSGVEIDLLRSAFDLARTNTMSAHAELDVVETAARWACPLCGSGLRPGQRLRCPTCDVPARLAGGGEIHLESVELEVT